MGPKRKIKGGRVGAPTPRRSRGQGQEDVDNVIVATNTIGTGESPPYSDMDEPQVEGYIKVELEPELDPLQADNNQQDLLEPLVINEIWVEPAIDIGEVEVKLLQYPEVEGEDEGVASNKDNEAETCRQPEFGDFQTRPFSSMSAEGSDSAMKSGIDTTSASIGEGDDNETQTDFSSDVHVDVNPLLNEKEGKSKGVAPARTGDKNIVVDQAYSSNDGQHLAAGRSAATQILPETEAATCDVFPETRQKLVKIKERIHKMETTVQKLLQTIEVKKEEAATLRLTPFKTSTEDSLLHLAVSQHDEKAVLDLIEKGANVNVKNRSGKIPLQKAISAYNGNSSLRIIKILIEKGSNVILNDQGSVKSSGDCFLQLLLYVPFLKSYVPRLDPSQFHEISKFMIGTDLSEHFNIPNRYGNKTPLQLAVLNLDVQLETLKMLHEHGVNFKVVDGHGRSVLAHAMQGGKSSSVMASLVKFGSDYSCLNDNGESILFYGAKGDDVQALKYFLTLNLDVNAVNKDGDTPLHFALRSVNKNVIQNVQVLILKKANINTLNNKGQTPLHVGAHNVIGDTCLDAIRLLFDGGADAFAKDKNGCIFLHHLMTNITLMPTQLHKIVEYLIVKNYAKMFDEVNTDKVTPLHLALQNIDVEADTLSLLREQGILDLGKLPDIIISDWLDRVAMGGNTEALKFLVMELDLDVNSQKNFWENTPLHRILLYGSQNVLREIAILMRGNERKNGRANVFIRNKGGRYPLAIAMERENMIDQEKVIHVLRHGIPSEYINRIDEIGENVQWAQLENHLQPQRLPLKTNSLACEESSSMDSANNTDDDDQSVSNSDDESEGSSSTEETLAEEPDAVKECKEILQRKILEVSSLRKELMKQEGEVARLKIISTSLDTELNLAISQGDEQVVMELIQNGADVNGRNEDGNTPLHTAMECNRMDINTRLNIIKLLIDEGADAYAVNHQGSPFVFSRYNWAAHLKRGEFYEIALALAEKNVDGVFNSKVLSRHNSCRVTVFQELMQRMDLKKGTLHQLHNVDFNAVDEGKLKRSVLWYAVTGAQSLDVVKNLVECGANPKYLTNLRENLLFAAAEDGCIESFNYFLSLGLDINAVNLCGNTPLHYVMNIGRWNNHLELTQFLIKSGANPNMKNKYCETPLHFAASRIEDNDTAISVINELLDNGAFPFAEDKKGRTFLHKIIDPIYPDAWYTRRAERKLTPSQFHDIAQYIIANKYTALFQQRNKYGKTPLEKALEKNILRLDTLSYIHDNNGIIQNVQSPNNPTTIQSLIHCAVIAGRDHIETLKFLYEVDQHVNGNNGGILYKGSPTTLEELIRIVERRGGMRRTARQSRGAEPLYRPCCGRACYRHRVD